MGEFVSVIAMRPVTFFILLTFAVLLLPSVVIPIWYHMMKKIEENVEMEATYAHHELITKVQDVAKLMLPINSSAINLANVLDTDIGDKLLFSEVQNKVAPVLFDAQLIMPRITQASYIGLDGLFFSYIKVGDQIFATYSNSTFPNNLDHYTWYTQLVNSNNGKLYGEARITKSYNVVSETWFKQAMASPSGYASLGFQWSTRDRNEGSSLFLDTARLGGKGAISLGFPVKGITNFLSSLNLLGASLYMATLGDGKVLIEGNKEANIKLDGDKALIQGSSNKGYVGEVPCKPNNDVTNNVGGTTLDIGGANFIFYCSIIDIATMPLAYVLAIPNKGLVSNIHSHTKVALLLLILMMVAMVISVFAFVALIVRAARREVHLCAAYMREMEKTAQAERKSMKQSLAFASANHDVRGYLACIKGLIDLSSNDLAPSSEVASNLRKIGTCAEDLLALVNSILDFSKIEAGKMQLEDKEFSLAQLLEDIADLHHPVAMKKGVEVILDPCDGSILKFSQVRGDRGKLKQILSNLLSNAVKFTSKGYICIRCHARKPSLENSIIASNKNNLLINRHDLTQGVLNRLSRFFHKNKRAYNDLEEMKTIKQDPSCMEFEFEVEDTGPGIPRDKRRSIFENFVQVKETSAGQVGTGLGLGIVQSLVRLMGGDIEIVDKANCENGTCFKFNIFLIVQEEWLDNPRQEITEHTRDMNSSSGLNTCVRSPRGEKSLVILLIKNDARRQMVHRYMESLGINLKVLSQFKQFSWTLKKIKSKLIEPQCYNNSSSGRSDLSPPRGTYLSSSSDHCCRGGPKSLPLNMMDGSDVVLPVYKRSSIRGQMKCILLVLDCNAGDDFLKLQRSVSEFRKDLYMTCIKVVWLERPDTRRTHFQGLQDESLPSTDLIISEPLHGSRLARIIRLLPEFGGDSVRSNTSLTVLLSNNSTQSETEEEFAQSSDGEIKPSSTRKRNLNFSSICSDVHAHEQEVPKIVRSSSSEKSTSITKITRKGEMEEVSRKVEVKKSSFEGLKILIVEDHLLQRKLAETCVSRLGAETQTCGNGKEALEVVCKALSNLPSEGISRFLPSEGISRFPYDCIIMDCQMPVMNGFEATMRIREEEKKYGLHIPIIALTAHEVDGEESKKIAEAGMDRHMTKPLQSEELLKLKQSLF